MLFRGTYVTFCLKRNLLSQWDIEDLVAFHKIYVLKRCTDVTRLFPVYWFPVAAAKLIKAYLIFFDM